MRETPKADWLGQEGAAELGRKIAGYWKSCGHEVAVWIEHTSGGAGGCWAVRSSLKGGLPPETARASR
jgi:hypothetical protein